MQEREFRFGFRVVGGRDQERRLTDWHAAFNAHLTNDVRADNSRECYLSSFQFADDFRDYLTASGSTRGFAGATWSAWWWFDIDRDNDLDTAMQDARRLVGVICDRWHIDADCLQLFFSGSKGLHIGLPTSLLNAQPRADFHFCVNRLASCLAILAQVEIDTGVYDRVRLFRAPNSRHQKTGLHKRRLTTDEFFGLSSTAVLRLAREPHESELPVMPPAHPQAARDWLDAVNDARTQVEAAQARRLDNARLNALTRAFICEGAMSGDRHRLLYSAARNLSEFACPADLAHALLTPSALDSGLSPSDVRRQIDCGLHDGGPHA